MHEVKSNLYKGKMKNENRSGHEMKEKDAPEEVDTKSDFKRTIFWSFGWDNFLKLTSK